MEVFPDRCFLKQRYFGTVALSQMTTPFLQADPFKRKLSLSQNHLSRDADTLLRAQTGEGVPRAILSSEAEESISRKSEQSSGAWASYRRDSAARFAASDKSWFSNVVI